MNLCVCVCMSLQENTDDSAVVKSWMFIDKDETHVQSSITLKKEKNL